MIGRGNRSTRRKTTPVQLCPPQNPHAARTPTRAAVVGSQGLTAWATAWPKFHRKQQQISTSKRMKSFTGLPKTDVYAYNPTRMEWRDNPRNIFLKEILYFKRILYADHKVILAKSKDGFRRYKLSGLSPQAKYTDRATAAVSEVVTTFAGRGCYVVSATDSHGR
jgi:hypothetical protein